MERVLAQILFISLQLGYLISENITGEQGGVGEREFRLEYVFLLIIHHSVISLPYLPPPLSLSHTHIHVHTHTVLIHLNFVRHTVIEYRLHRDRNGENKEEKVFNFTIKQNLIFKNYCSAKIFDFVSTFSKNSCLSQNRVLRTLNRVPFSSSLQ